MTRIFLILMLLAPLPAFPQRVVVNSLEQALDLARQHNHELKQAQLRIQSSRQDAKAAQALLLPQLRFVSTTDNYLALPTQLIPAEFLGGAEGEFHKVQFGTRYQHTSTLEASMPLINAGYWKNTELAGVQQQAAEARARSAEWQLTEQVSRVYYLVLLSQYAGEVSEQHVQLSDSLLRSAQQKAANGLLEPLDLNRVHATHLQSLDQRDQNRQVLLQNLTSLKRLLGLNPDEELEVTASLATAEPAPLAGQLQAVQTYPEFRARQLAAEAARLGLQRERLRRLPEVSLYGRASQQAFRKDFTFFQSNQTWLPFALVGLRIDLPLFAGFARSTAITKAGIEQQLAQNELAEYIRTTTAENEELQQNYQLAGQRLQSQGKAVRLHEENYHLGLFKYQQGVYTLEQTLGLYRDLLQAQNQHVNRLSDYLIYQSHLKIKSRGE